jgi:hypothetical protein
MHPLVSQAVTAERVRDMRAAGDAARRARMTRRTRPGHSVLRSIKRTPDRRLRVLGA